MRFSYEINILNSNKTKKSFIEATDIQQALSRIKNIMFSGATGSFQVGYFEKTNNFIKGEVWKERPREKPTKEYSFIIKALSKTQDSGSRVFDRLFKVLNKVQDDRQTENKKMEQIRNKKVGDEVKPKKIFNISAHSKDGNSVRKFIAIGANESEVKNKVKRLFLTRGEYDFIISENPAFSMERFNKLAQGKEVIRNELRS